MLIGGCDIESLPVCKLDHRGAGQVVPLLYHTPPKQQQQQQQNTNYKDYGNAVKTCLSTRVHVIYPHDGNEHIYILIWLYNVIKLRYAMITNFNLINICLFLKE